MEQYINGVDARISIVVKDEDGRDCYCLPLEQGCFVDLKPYSVVSGGHIGGNRLKHCHINSTTYFEIICLSKTCQGGQESYRTA
jgi:hypothetical protein